MSHSVNIKSEWRVELLDHCGAIKEVVDWTKNTLTVQGFNVWATDRKGLLFSATLNNNQIHKMGFGSSAVPALWSNISLVDEVYRADIDASLSSSVVDVVDTTAPFILLGASIPSGEGPFTINEIGLFAHRTGVYSLFNRVVLPTTISKLENDTLNAQCKITIEYIYDDTPEQIDVRSLGGNHLAYSTAQTVILAPGVQRFFEYDWLNSGVEEAHIGSSTQAPAITDTDVVTAITTVAETGTVSCSGSAVTTGDILDYFQLEIIAELFGVEAATTIREISLVSDGVGFRTVFGQNMVTRSYYPTDMLLYWHVRFTQ